MLQTHCKTNILRNISICSKRLGTLLILTLFFSSIRATTEASPEFHTINILNGLSHNMVNAIHKDSHGFIWLGTLLGLDRFDGIDVVHYPQLKEHSVYAICETDSLTLWAGTDKGLIQLNRKTEEIEKFSLNENDLTIRTLHPLSPDKMLIGSSQGLFIWEKGEIERIHIEGSALSPTNNIAAIVETELPTIFYIASTDGLIYLDLNDKQTKVYKYPSSEPGKSSYSCLARAENILYLGTRESGVVTFNLHTKQFHSFPYKGNPYIKTIQVGENGSLYVGTDGEGVHRVSIKDGSILKTLKRIPGNKGISSNAIYSFLKDGDTYWIGTYMGGLSYTPMSRNLFSTYQFNALFDSKNSNIRSFYIASNGQKIIGTREGMFYISEHKNIAKHYTSQSSILQADIIMSVFPLSDQEYLVGTFGGGLYKFHAPTATLSYFSKDERFQKGSFTGFRKDKEENIWISSSQGMFIYNPQKEQEIIHYTNANSGLKNNHIYSTLIDSNNRVWFGTTGGVTMYDLADRSFNSDMFPTHILPYTKNIHYMYEDKHKNIWFCDAKEGVIKVDEHFTAFEHFTTATFLPSNSVTSIQEDVNGNMWIATQRGLLNLQGKGENPSLYSLYDGIPGYIFNSSAQQTSDGTMWWGNEQGLVYYNPIVHAGKQSAEKAPVITSISVAGKKLHAGSELMPYSSIFTSEMSISTDSSIELNFSALNYSHVNANIYEYILEGYDKEWQMLMTGNKASYSNLPQGKYVFKVKLSSGSNEQCSTLRLTVHKNFSAAWLVILSILAMLALVFSYSRLLSKYRQIKAGFSAKKEDSSDPKEKYAKVRMEEKDIENIRKRLTTYMEKEKGYLNPDLKLQDVANIIGCNSVELSLVLNVHLNTSFFDYINGYRVEEFIIRIQHESSSKYTLSSLSEQCGFSSRTSFFRSFKKIKGTTPADYIKSIGVELRK